MAKEYVLDKKGNLIEIEVDEPSKPSLDEKLSWIGQSSKDNNKDKSK